MRRLQTNDEEGGDEENGGEEALIRHLAYSTRGRERPLVLRTDRARYFFIMASRLALNSVPGFHSGNLAACATR
jgi:hypothetical protein